MRGKKAFKRAMALLLSAVMGFTVLVSDANAVTAVAATAQNDSIHFEYVTGDNTGNGYQVGVNTVKFTIDLIDENGAYTYGKEIAGAESFTKDTAEVKNVRDLFENLSIKGYAYNTVYFYWNNNNDYKGEKVVVSSFKNYGRTNNNQYQSYIGYSCDRAGANDFEPGYYAYNPTGTLRVVFEKNKPYNVVYMSIGEKFTDNKTSTDFIPQPIQDEPTREGYSFEGWATAADGNGNGVANAKINNSFYSTALDSDITLYAIWEEIPVVYSTTYYSMNKAVATITDVDGKHVKYKGKLDAPKDRQFVGWTTEAEDKGPQKGNGKGTVVSDAFFDAIAESDAVLYAKWEKVKDVEFYILKRDKNSGKRIKDEQAKVDQYSVNDYYNKVVTLKERLTAEIDGVVKTYEEVKGNAVGITDGDNYLVTDFLDKLPTEGEINKALGRENALKDDEEIQWYVIKDVSGKIHVDGAIVKIQSDVKAAIVTAQDIAITYGEEVPTFTYTSDVQENFDVTYSVIDEEGNPVDSLEMLSVGDYTIIPSVAEKEGYEVSTGNGTLKVSPLAITVDVTGERKDVSYNGEPRVFELNIDCELESELFKKDYVSYAGDITVSGKNAGEYTLVLNATDFSYSDKNLDVTFNVVENGLLVIEKLDATIKAISPEDIVYGDDLPELKAEVTGTVSGEDLAYKLQYDQEDVSDVGEYAIVVVVDEDAAVNKNYNISVEGAELRIVHAELKESGIDIAFTKTYGDADPNFNTDENKIAVIKALFANAGLPSFSENMNILEYIDVNIYRKDTGVNVGTYDLFVDGPIFIPQEQFRPLALLENEIDDEVNEVVENAPIYVGNYEITEPLKVGTLTINKRTAYVRMNNASKYVGDSDPMFSASVSNTAYNDSIFVDPWRIAGEGAGTYAIHANVGENANYNIDFTPGTLTILARQEEVIVPPVTPPTRPTVTPVTPTPTPTTEEEVVTPPAEEEVIEIAPEETPQAAAPETEAAPEVVIEEEPVPEAAATCWIHWLVLAFALVYAIYAAVRAVQNKRELEDESEALED